MARCEDFPCCGHELGCCPNYDEAGRQLDMVCTCGARLPVDNRFSICDSCLGDDEDRYAYDEYDGQPDEYTEWQDYYGGDDWDHGQYDEY